MEHAPRLSVLDLRLHFPAVAHGQRPVSKGVAPGRLHGSRRRSGRNRAGKLVRTAHSAGARAARKAKETVKESRSSQDCDGEPWPASQAAKPGAFIPSELRRVPVLLEAAQEVTERPRTLDTKCSHGQTVLAHRAVELTPV